MFVWPQPYGSLTYLVISCNKIRVGSFADKEVKYYERQLDTGHNGKWNALFGIVSNTIQK